MNTPLEQEELATDLVERVAKQHLPLLERAAQVLREQGKSSDPNAILQQRMALKSLFNPQLDLSLIQFRQRNPEAHEEAAAAVLETISDKQVRAALRMIMFAPSPERE